MTKTIVNILTALFLIFNMNSFSQEYELSESEKEEVVDSTCNLLLAHYIDFETAQKMTKALKSNFRKDKYANTNICREFAAQIQVDLSAISNDKHFHFMYDPDAIARSKETGDDETLNQLLNDKHINFGFNEVKILEGNVGYIKLDRFPYPSDVGDVASGALSMLSNSDAIIIDLSDNRGGYLEMVQYLMSYFFKYPIHINTIYERFANTNEQFWTYPYPNGKIMDSVDVYILTSNRTFSAGEWFAYSMQNNDKAIVVGEVTKGGASPSDMFYVNENFMMLIPNEKCISSVTNTNFNNVGVQPDVLCENSEAKNTAYEIALKKLDSLAIDENIKNEYEWILDGLTAKNNTVIISNDILQTYEGDYGRSTIFIQNKKIYFRLPSGNEYEMIPISNTYFLLEGLDFFRVEIVSEDNIPSAIKGIYSNGYTNTVEKN